MRRDLRDGGASLSNTSDPRFEISCDYATPIGGVGASWAIDDGQNMDSAGTIGRNIGPSWGGKVGCSSMFVVGG